MKFNDTRKGQWPEKKQNCLIISESAVELLERMTKTSGMYPSGSDFETAIFLGVSKKNQSIASWECGENPDSPLEWQDSPYWLPAPYLSSQV